MVPHSDKKISSFIFKHPILTLFGFNYLAIFFFYSSFILVEHYSSDTYFNYIFPDNNVAINVAHGRYVSAAVYKLFAFLHFDYTHHVLAGQLLWVAVYAWALAVLTMRFHACMKTSGTQIRIWQLDFILLAIACNLGAMENLLFPDIIYTSAMSRALVFGAVILWCTQDKKIGHYIASFLLLCMALDIYQTFIGVYVILGTAFVLAKFRMHVHVKAVQEEIGLLVIGAVASLQSLLLMKIPSVLSADGSKYLAETSVHTLTDNASKILQEQPRVWFGFLGFLPTYMPAAFLIAAIAVFIVVLYREKICTVVDAVVIGIAFLGCAFMPFAPQLFAETVWIPPRTLESLFSFLVLPGLLVLPFAKKTSKRFIMGLYALLLVIMFVQAQKISINNAMSSAVDEEFSRQIEYQIEQYEERTGNVVDTVAVRYDANPSYSYKSVDYAILDTNLSAFATTWSDTYAVTYYSGKMLERRDMTEEEYNKYFGESEWDVFCPEEQIRFEGNTMFWAKY